MGRALYAGLIAGAVCAWAGGGCSGDRGGEEERDAGRDDGGAHDVGWLDLLPDWLLREEAEDAVGEPRPESGLDGGDVRDSVAGDDEGVAACPPGRGECDGDPATVCETDLNAKANCGGCGRVCELPHANTRCIDGECRFSTCASGWHDCDGNHANGCEASLGSVEHCGSCDNRCALAHATPTCSAGRCLIASCASGWGDCNDRDSDGCETHLTTPSHCGSCSRSCTTPPNIFCDGGRCATHTVSVDQRDFVLVATPGFKMCNDRGGCLDGGMSPSNEYTVHYSHGIIDIYARITPDHPALVGVLKNREEAGHPWRCFANPGGQCDRSTTYPPHGVPLIMGLPVLHGSSIRPASATPGAEMRVTRGATLVPEYSTWRPFDIHTFHTGPPCGDDGVAGPTQWSRAWAFVADAIDFGGTLGRQTNVLVLEFEGGDRRPDSFWTGAELMERYYFVRGFGRVREARGINGWCDDGRDGYSHCNGYYQFQHQATYNTRTAGDYDFPTICAF